MAGTGAAQLADNLQTQAIEELFDSNTGQYYVPYNPITESMRNSLRNKGYTGEGQTIAILDTGMLLHHPSLKGRVVDSMDFTNEGPEDLNGHGTVVALIAAGPAPGPSILNVKVADRNGTAAEESVLAGMRWAAESGADVLSISLGISRDCDGTCVLCGEATKIREKGISILAAAGNDPRDHCCPAQCDAVIAVGAMDYMGTAIANYSGSGNVYAPGTFKRIPVNQPDGEISL